MAAPRAAGAGVDVAHDPNQLAEPLRSAVLWLIANSPPADPVTLTSGRRSNAQQIQLRIEHGCGGANIYNHACKGVPQTAVPGTSKHEKGMAADLGGNLGFVEANAAMLGIGRTVSSENWHYEWIGPNRPPGAGFLSSIGLTGAGPAGTSTAGSGGAQFAGSGGGASGWQLLTDGHTWFRALLVIAGGALIVAGVGQLTGGLKVAGMAAFPEAAVLAKVAA